MPLFINTYGLFLIVSLLSSILIALLLVVPTPIQLRKSLQSSGSVANAYSISVDAEAFSQMHDDDEEGGEFLSTIFIPLHDNSVVANTTLNDECWWKKSSLSSSPQLSFFLDSTSVSAASSSTSTNHNYLKATSLFNKIALDFEEHWMWEAESFLEYYLFGNGGREVPDDDVGIADRLLLYQTYFNAIQSGSSNSFSTMRNFSFVAVNRSGGPLDCGGECDLARYAVTALTASNDETSSSSGNCSFFQNLPLASASLFEEQFFMTVVKEFLFNASFGLFRRHFEGSAQSSGDQINVSLVPDASEKEERRDRLPSFVSLLSESRSSFACLSEYKPRVEINLLTMMLSNNGNRTSAGNASKIKFCLPSGDQQMRMGCSNSSNDEGGFLLLSEWGIDAGNNVILRHGHVEKMPSENRKDDESWKNSTHLFLPLTSFLQVDLAFPIPNLTQLLFTQVDPNRTTALKEFLSSFIDLETLNTMMQNVDISKTTTFLEVFFGFLRSQCGVMVPLKENTDSTSSSLLHHANIPLSAISPIYASKKEETSILDEEWRVMMMSMPSPNGEKMEEYKTEQKRIQQSLESEIQMYITKYQRNSQSLSEPEWWTLQEVLIPSLLQREVAIRASSALSTKDFCLKTSNGTGNGLMTWLSFFPGASLFAEGIGECIRLPSSARSVEPMLSNNADNNDTIASLYEENEVFIGSIFDGMRSSAAGALTPSCSTSSRNSSSLLFFFMYRVTIFSSANLFAAARDNNLPSLQVSSAFSPLLGSTLLRFPVDNSANSLSSLKWTNFSKRNYYLWGLLSAFFISGTLMFLSLYLSTSWLVELVSELEKNEAVWVFTPTRWIKTTEEGEEDPDDQDDENSSVASRDSAAPPLAVITNVKKRKRLWRKMQLPRFPSLLASEKDYFTCSVRYFGAGASYSYTKGHHRERESIIELINTEGDPDEMEEAAVPVISVEGGNFNVAGGVSLRTYKKSGNQSQSIGITRSHSNRSIDPAISTMLIPQSTQRPISADDQAVKLLTDKEIETAMNLDRQGGTAVHRGFMNCRGSVVFVSMSEFERIAAGDATEAEHISGDFLAEIASAAKKFDGFLYLYSMASAVIVWNVTIPRMAHEVLAIKCADTIRQKLNFYEKVCISVSCGKISVSRNMKPNILLGEAMDIATGMNNYQAKKRLPVLITSDIAFAAGNAVRQRSLPLDILSFDFDKRNEKACHVYLLAKLTMQFPENLTAILRQAFACVHNLEFETGLNAITEGLPVKCSSRLYLEKLIHYFLEDKKAMRRVRNVGSYFRKQFEWTQSYPTTGGGGQVDETDMSLSIPVNAQPPTATTPLHDPLILSSSSVDHSKTPTDTSGDGTPMEPGVSFEPRSEFPSMTKRQMNRLQHTADMLQRHLMPKFQSSAGASISDEAALRIVAQQSSISSATHSSGNYISSFRKSVRSSQAGSSSGSTSANKPEIDVAELIPKNYVDDRQKMWYISPKLLSSRHKDSKVTIFLGASQDGIPMAVIVTPISESNIANLSVEEVEQNILAIHNSAVAYAIKHEHSVAVHSITNYGNKVLLTVMEHMSGGTLYKFINNFNTAGLMVCIKTYAKEILSLLRYLQQNFICHRLLNLHSVSLGMDGRCKVSRYDYAVFLSSSSAVAVDAQRSQRSSSSVNLMSHSATTLFARSIQLLQKSTVETEGSGTDSEKENPISIKLTSSQSGKKSFGGGVASKSRLRRDELKFLAPEVFPVNSTTAVFHSPQHISSTLSPNHSFGEHPSALFKVIAPKEESTTPDSQQRGGSTSGRLDLQVTPNSDKSSGQTMNISSSMSTSTAATSVLLSNPSGHVHLNTDIYSFGMIVASLLLNTTGDIDVSTLKEKLAHCEAVDGIGSRSTGTSSSFVTSTSASSPHVNSSSEREKMIEKERNKIISFIMPCLNADPAKRPSAEQLLFHPFFS